MLFLLQPKGNGDVQIYLAISKFLFSSRMARYRAGDMTLTLGVLNPHTMCPFICEWGN